MEENVALDTSKQKQFVKSIKGIKKLIKKTEKKAKSEDVSVETVLKRQNDKDRKKKRKRGLVYLSHIPHGFYEHQMTQYFKQFGVVTNARVIRSKRTGNSKGYAFVEFKEPTVGQIVAETMNNYLMGKRLIKAVFIPPRKQRNATRKHWSTTHNPGNELGLKMKKAYNADKSKGGDLQKAKQLLANLSKTKKKLTEFGINYDFFTPVDVPVSLNNIQTKIEETEEKENVAKNKKTKKGKKLPEAAIDVSQKGDKDKKLQKPSIEVRKKAEKGKKIPDGDTILAKVSQKGDKGKEKGAQKPIITNKQESKRDTKLIVPDTKQTKKEQKQKKQTLEDKGVKLLEEFIEVHRDESDSDSTYVFDSDEYTKKIEDEDEFNSLISSGESDDEIESNGEVQSDYEAESDDEDSDNESAESDGDILGFEDSEEDLPPNPKQKDKPVPKPSLKVQQAAKKNASKQEAPKPQQKKRKAQEKPVSPKKPKFERQNQKPLNKQLKKKK